MQNLNAKTRMMIGMWMAMCFSSNLWADVTVRFEGARGQVLFENVFPLAENTTVGDLSIFVLDREARLRRLPYQGSREGVRSIDVMGSAMEVVSDRIMRAYGWCFSVNGQIPLLYSHQIPLRLAFPQERNARIVWFYSYAFYDSGEWKNMCVPADHIPAPEDRQ